MKLQLSQTKMGIILFFVALFILTLALYYQNLQAFFVSDDFEWLAVSIDRNPLNFFITNYAGTNQGGSYGPLVNLVYYFSYQLGQLNPLPYHLVSLFFHFGNIVLLYLVTRKLLGNKVALLASLLFTVYFNNAEAVVWIAAIPHLLSTFFWLLAFYLWLIFKEKKQWLIYCLSLLAFILALLAKEIALSLPVVILILSFIQYQQAKISFSRRNLAYLLIGYFVVLLGYLGWRYYTTGMLFGYYGRSQLGFNPKIYLENLYYLLFTFISSGDFRVFLISLAKNHLKILLPLSFLLTGGLIYVLRYKIKIVWPYVLLFLIILAPYLSLAPNPLNNEGERYTYLPVLCLMPALAYVLAKQRWRWPRVVIVLLVLIIFSSAYLLYQKNKVWATAGQVSKNIVLEFGQIVDPKNQASVYFIYLPDNLAGAQVFRNAVSEAIDLYYPDNNLVVKTLPIHIILNPRNQIADLFVWEKIDKPNQFLGQVVTKENLITGPTAAESNDDLIFELWGYNYETFTTNRIFLEFKDKLSEQNNPVYLLYYNAGQLQLLKSP